MKYTIAYRFMVGGGLLGMAAAFLQTLEKITLLANKDAALVCNLNSVFSCSAVLQAWQSSVFGFPNSIMCMAFFTIFMTVALVGATGGQIPKNMRLSIQALALATLGFGLWFIWQSIFVISAICIFCVFCIIGLLIVNGAWLRINANDLPISKRAHETLSRATESGLDIFIWIVIGLVIAFAMLLRFQ